MFLISIYTYYIDFIIIIFPAMSQEGISPST